MTEPESTIPSFAARNHEAALRYPGKAKRQDQFCEGAKARCARRTLSNYHETMLVNAQAGNATAKQRAASAGWRWADQWIKQQQLALEVTNLRKDRDALRVDLAAARKDARKAVDDRDAAQIEVQKVQHAYNSLTETATRLRADLAAARREAGAAMNDVLRVRLGQGGIIPDPKWSTDPAPPAGTRYESYAGTMFVIGADGFVYRWVGDGWPRAHPVINAIYVMAFCREVTQ